MQFLHQLHQWLVQAMQLAPLAAVVAVAIGWIITYANSLRLERQKAQIKFVSDQLQFLYGPLFSLSSASFTAWQEFTSTWPPGREAFFGIDPPPTEEELKQWRLWMSEVFMPLNLRIEKAIVENAHLIEGGDMPAEFKQFLAHVAVYKIVLKSWERNDFTRHIAHGNYPRDFDETVAKTFRNLKRRQTQLIGEQSARKRFGGAL